MKNQISYFIYGYLRKIEKKIDILLEHLGVIVEMEGEETIKEKKKRNSLSAFPTWEEIKKRKKVKK